MRNYEIYVKLYPSNYYQMGEKNSDMQTEKLKIEFDYLKGELSEIKSMIQKVNESLTSLRNDVNQANNIATSNKISIKQNIKHLQSVDNRVTHLEKQFSSYVAVGKFIKWVIGLLGVTGIASLVATFML